MPASARTDANGCQQFQKQPSGRARPRCCVMTGTANGTTPTLSDIMKRPMRVMTGIPSGDALSNTAVKNRSIKPTVGTQNPHNKDAKTNNEADVKTL